METMLRLCEESQDNWAFEVKGRLLTCGDLHAAEAVYHKSCHRDFCHPKSADSVNVSAGRCVDHEKSDVFDVVCDMLQNGESELYTVNELIDLMKSLVADDRHVYSFPYMKQKLQERFRDSIFFTDIYGRNNVVCFRDDAHHIEKVILPVKDIVLSKLLPSLSGPIFTSCLLRRRNIPQILPSGTGSWRNSGCHLFFVRFFVDARFR